MMAMDGELNICTAVTMAPNPNLSVPPAKSPARLTPSLESFASLTQLATLPFPYQTPFPSQGMVYLYDYFN